MHQQSLRESGTRNKSLSLIFSITMKLLLLFITQVLSSTIMVISPIFFHYLRSNNYMSPSDDIETLLNSPSIHTSNPELAQIVIKAQAITRLLIPQDGSKARVPSQNNVNAVEGACHRNVLERVLILNSRQIWFQQKYNSVESNIDSYYGHLYWTSRDLNFLTTIKPYKDKALAMVLHSLEEKMSNLMEEIQGLSKKVPLYSKLVWNAYTPTVLAPSSDINWTEANGSVEATVHFSLLSELLRCKIIDSKSLTSCRESFTACYKALMDSTGNENVYFNLDVNLIPPAFNLYRGQYYPIIKSWFHLWSVGKHIGRPMPSPSQLALGPSLIESFNMEIRAMTELINENEEKRRYALYFSCVHMDYLLGCMHVALSFSLLNYQDHANCVQVILAHRALAMKMIVKNSQLIKNYSAALADTYTSRIIVKETQHTV